MDNLQRLKENIMALARIYNNDQLFLTIIYQSIYFYNLTENQLKIIVVILQNNPQHIRYFFTELLNKLNQTNFRTTFNSLLCNILNFLRQEVFNNNNISNFIYILTQPPNDYLSFRYMILDWLSENISP